MGILNVSGFTHQWSLIQTHHFFQIHSMTHGHTGSQTFPNITNSLLWSARHREITLPGRTAICVVWSLFFYTCYLTDNFFLGGGHKYRSPQEFYPHMHWLLDNTQGVRNPCICQYCDPSRSQKQINKTFPLPPHKESAKGPRGPKKHKQTRKLQGPKGVTVKRGLIINRNSITSGPVTTLGDGWQKHKFIGYKTSHPFQ